MRFTCYLNMVLNLKMLKMSPDCLSDNTWKALQPALIIKLTFLFANTLHPLYDVVTRKFNADAILFEENQCK